MSTRIEAIDFDKYSSLEAFRESVVAATREGGMPVVLFQGAVLFTAVPPAVTKDLISRRVVDMLSENPELLTDLQKRIETEEPEDWE